MKIGDKYQIHCYKHNGKAYQASDETIIIDIKKDYMVDVFEPEGHSYKKKELAIIFFYKKHWFNCIAQLKNFGLYYYCNMATPYIVDENVIKYIDYDLDLKVWPGYRYKVLDEGEYAAHRIKYQYSDELDEIFHEQLNRLIVMTMNASGPFRAGFAQEWYNKYQQMMKNRGTKNDKLKK